MPHSDSGITFLLTEEQFVRANRLYLRLTTVARLWYLAAIAALIVVAILSPPGLMRYAAIGSVVGGIAGHFVTRYFVVPWRVRRLFRAYPAARESAVVKVTDAGVRFRTDTSDSTLIWEHILKWREDDEFVLIYQNPQIYHILPKALQSSGLDVVGLVTHLRENVGQAA